MNAEIETILAEAEKSACDIRDYFLKAGIARRSISELDPEEYESLGRPTVYLPRFSRFQPETKASLLAIEQSLGAAIPTELKDLLTDVGGFYCEIDGEGFSLTFKNRRPAFPRVIGGLADVLEKQWGWDENRDYLEPEIIQKMNAGYFCFGNIYVDENTCDHFYFDREHNYRILRYSQDFSDDDAHDHLYELVSGSNLRPSIELRELIVPRLSEAKRRLLEYTAMIVDGK